MPLNHSRQPYSIVLTVPMMRSLILVINNVIKRHMGGLLKIFAPYSLILLMVSYNSLKYYYALPKSSCLSLSKNLIHASLKLFQMRQRKIWSLRNGRKRMKVSLRYLILYSAFWAVWFQGLWRVMIHYLADCHVPCASHAFKFWMWYSGFLDRWRRCWWWNCAAKCSLGWTSSIPSSWSLAAIWWWYKVVLVQGNPSWIHLH